MKLDEEVEHNQTMKPFDFTTDLDHGDLALLEYSLSDCPSFTVWEYMYASL